MEKQASKVVYVCVKRDIVLHWIRNVKSKSACHIAQFGHAPTPAAHWYMWDHLLVQHAHTGKKTYNVRVFFVCVSFSQKVPHVIHGTANIRVWCSQTRAKWREKRGIIINWCLMSHRKIYCIECKVENSENVKRRT